MVVTTIGQKWSPIHVRLRGDYCPTRAASNDWDVP